MEGKELPLYGDGMNVRSWIHVSDHNRALLLIAEKGRTGEIYNIGSDQEGERPNREVAEKIVDILNKPRGLIQFVEDRLAHDRRYAVTSEKLRSELGWAPTVSFERGLEDTIQWYRDNSAWWQEIKSGEYQHFYEKNYAHR